MMLKNSFYTIKNQTNTEGGSTYQISLNPSHAIYKAHFPGNPVTPGVCIVQIIKELAADLCKKNFFIRTVKNVKFLGVINPLTNPELTVPLTFTKQEDGMTAISSTITDGEKVFSKVNLMLEEV